MSTGLLPTVMQDGGRRSGDFNPQSADSQFSLIFATMESNKEQANEFRKLFFDKLDELKHTCEMTLNQAMKTNGRVSVLEVEHRQNTDTLAQFLRKTEATESLVLTQAAEFDRHKSFAKGILWVAGGLSSIWIVFIELLKVGKGTP